MNKIITINRQFGSGGREVGKRLADELQIAYYDKELVEHLSENSIINPNYMEDFEDAIATRHYAFTFGRTFSLPLLTPTEQLQRKQAKIIKEIANKQDCVIVGRCANYILKEKAFKVFIFSSDMDMRIQRCYDKNKDDFNISKVEMEKQIAKIDHQRSKYYQSFTGEKWLDMSHYNLCIDTAKIDIKKAVELIVKALR